MAALDKTPKVKKKFVAIKKIENSFELKTYTKRTLRELRLQRILKHENVSIYIANYFPKIIGIEEILLPKNREEFKEMYSLITS